MKGVLITGVSSGIGRAAAADLLGHGYSVFGSVRKQSDAEMLRDELGERFTALLFDVTDEKAIQAAVGEVSERLGGKGLWALINNAGIAVPGPLMHISLDDFRYQFEVNVFGLLAVTQAFLPLLGAKFPQEHEPGRIINISSVSGTIVYPFLGPYASSKHAVEAMSDALRRELNIYGIQVAVVAPGSVRSPIWDKAEQEDVSSLAGTDYEAVLRDFQRSAVERGRRGIPVERVLAAIRDALEHTPPKTRYHLPSRRFTGWILPRLLPARLFDRIVTARMGLERRDR